ncbi:MAG: hypothetical protein K0B01_09190 [Syntrophobacterales bacterium]|nr:hypothetical protein [Syntrophobacterales bacterium]
MAASLYSVDSMINAYNKHQRVKARHISSADEGGEKKDKSADKVYLSKQGIEAEDICNKLTDKLIDTMLKDDKKKMKA